MEKLKRYWRLILGFGFIYSGITYLSTDFIAGWYTFGIGVTLVLWHAIRLFLNARGNRGKK